MNDGYLKLADALEPHGITPHGDDDWRDYARCKQGFDPELWFPVGTTGPAEAQLQSAKAVCALCPVRELCLQWSLDTAQDAGVWGGLSEEERRKLRRAERHARPHGTTSRYDQGCRCKPCSKAKVDAVRRSRKHKQRSA